MVKRSNPIVSSKEAEYALSQVFITISPYKFANQDMVDSIILNILDDLKKSKPAEEGNKVRYPGENILKTREINKKRGIPVNASIWDSILSL